MAITTNDKQDRDMMDEILSLMNAQIDAGKILEFVQDNYGPDEVYANEKLEEWAEMNGYVKNDA